MLDFSCKVQRWHWYSRGIIVLLFQCLYINGIKIRIFVTNARIMNSKLTLTIEKSTIEKAKRYAKQSGRSLSNLIETYLENLTRMEASPEEVPEEFKDLFGSVDLTSDMDDKQMIRSILAEKYKV